MQGRLRKGELPTGRDASELFAPGQGIAKRWGTIVITGASSPLGLHTAVELYKRKACKTLILCLWDKPGHIFRGLAETMQACAEAEKDLPKDDR